MPPPRIVVFGGSGFLGSRICRAALQRQCLVTSISRSIPKVRLPDLQFQSADVLHPEDYSQHLRGASAIIYCVGTLLEGNYKTAEGKIDPDKMFELVRQAQMGNPLKLDPENPQTYNKLSRDGAILAALEGIKCGVPTFTYISAAGRMPTIPARYIESKREAEQVISTHPELKDIRPVIIRPGMMYDSEDGNNPVVVAMKSISQVTSLFNRVFGAFKDGSEWTYMGVPPLDVDVVARATVTATLNPSIRGVVDVDKITQLAS